MKKILFLANHFITLYAFRKELIIRLLGLGHEVYLSLPESNENRFFIDCGCKIVLTDIDRRGISPFKDMRLIKFYKKIIYDINPDIIFSYTIKPNIYGSFVSNKNFKQVCNITGTGEIFLKKNFISFLCIILYKISIKKCYIVLFQNKGDQNYFINNKMVNKNYELIPGSGCNLKKYKLLPMHDDKIIRFVFIGRVMKLKGIEEYLAAAQSIKYKFPNTEFMVVGWCEEKNYKEKLRKFQELEIINYLGFQKNIVAILEKCHCVVLPSHGGEGVPNVLLEASASGRACIGSKIHGTEDVIVDRVTGYLFNPYDSSDLANKMEQFIGLDKNEKATMGLLGREKIKAEFDREIIIKKYLNLIDS